MRILLRIVGSRQTRGVERRTLAVTEAERRRRLMYCGLDKLFSTENLLAEASDIAVHPNVVIL